MPHPVLETDECIGCGICVLISFFPQISRTPLMLIGIKNEKVTQGDCG